MRAGTENRSSHRFTFEHTVDGQIDFWHAGREQAKYEMAQARAYASHNIKVSTADRSGKLTRAILRIKSVSFSSNKANIEII